MASPAFGIATTRSTSTITRANPNCSIIQAFVVKCVLVLPECAQSVLIDW